MSDERSGSFRDPEFDRRFGAWLDEGPDGAPRAFVDATLAPIPAMAQRRRSLVAFGRLTITVAALARVGVATAVVVAIAASGGLLRSGPYGGGGSSAAPSSSATGEPLPSGVSYTNPGPLGASSGIQPGRAGTYQTLLFHPALRFTVPAGWSVNSLVDTFVGGGEGAAGIPIGDGEGAIVVTAPTSVRPPAPGVAGSPVPSDLMGWIVGDRDLALAGAPRTVTIAGIAGTEVEGTLDQNAEIDPVDGFCRPVDFLPLLPRHRFRIAVLRVGGTQVIVATVANADEFDAFKSQADAVIASFAFVGS